jgi:hypothetical protein
MGTGLSRCSQESSPLNHTVLTPRSSRLIPFFIMRYEWTSPCRWPPAQLPTSSRQHEMAMLVAGVLWLACSRTYGRILGHTCLWESRERELDILIVASLRHMACLRLAIPNRFFRCHGTPISIFVITPEPAIHFWIMLAYLFPPGEPRLVYDSLTIATAFLVTCLHHVDV